MNNVQNGQCLYYAMSCSTEKILKISPEADLSLWPLVFNKKLLTFNKVMSLLARSVNYTFGEAVMFIFYLYIFHISVKKNEKVSEFMAALLLKGNQMIPALMFSIFTLAEKRIPVNWWLKHHLCELLVWSNATLSDVSFLSPLCTPVALVPLYSRCQNIEKVCLFVQSPLYLAGGLMTA